MKSKNIFLKALVLMVSLLLVIPVSSEKAKAYVNYGENTTPSISNVGADRTNNEIYYTVTIPVGISNFRLYVCRTSEPLDYRCSGSSDYISEFSFSDIDLNTQAEKWIMNVESDSPASSTQKVKNPHIGTQVSDYSSDQKTFVYYAVANVCNFPRVNDNENPCLNYEEDVEIGHGTFTLSNELTGNVKINQTVATLLNYLKTIGIPVLWGLLLVLLVVRGILLGMQIVKSSDEAEVRKQKISGLVWLFVGVGVGYVATVIGYFVLDNFLK